MEVLPFKSFESVLFGDSTTNKSAMTVQVKYVSQTVNILCKMYSLGGTEVFNGRCGVERSAPK